MKEERSAENTIQINLATSLKTLSEKMEKEMELIEKSG
jgi:hypothetical protein